LFIYWKRGINTESILANFSSTSTLRCEDEVQFQEQINEICKVRDEDEAAQMVKQHVDMAAQAFLVTASEERGIGHGSMQCHMVNINRTVKNIPTGMVAVGKAASVYNRTSSSPANQNG
jgi:hypothetical protein